MKTIYSLLLTFCLLSVSFGQTLDEKLKVVKEYDNEIYAVNPLFDYNSILLPDDNHQRSIGDSLLTIDRVIPDIDVDIRPLSFLSPQKEKPYHGFIRGDVGQLNELGILAAYVHSVDNYFNVEADFAYDKWQDATVTEKFIRKSEGSLAFKYYLTNKLYARLKVKGMQSKLGLYAFNQEVTDESRGFIGNNQFNTSFDLNSFNSDRNAWNYQLNLNYNRTSSENSGHKENTFWVLAGLTKGLGSQVRIDLNGRSEFSNNDLLNNLSQQVVDLVINYSNQKVESKIGARLNAYQSEIRFFPQIAIKYHWDEKTTVGVKVVQSIFSQGYGQLSKQNPYIDPFSLELFYSSLQSYELGVKTIITPDYKLEVITKYQNWKDAPNFHSSDPGSPRFVINRVDFRSMSVQVGIEKILLQNLSVGADVIYTHFINQSATLTHRPNINLEPYIQYSLFKGRLNMSVTGIVDGGQKIGDTEGRIVDAGIRKDLSASIKFALAGRLNVYLNADNILNDDYNVWSGYHVFGRNLSAGLLLKL